MYHYSRDRYASPLASAHREPPIPPIPEDDPAEPGREPPLPPDSPYPGRPLQDPPVAPPGTPTQPPPEIIARLRKRFGNIARGTKWRLCALGCALGLIFATSSATAQEDQVTDVEVRGHVYEPRKLKLTPENLARIEAPDGFQVQLFASGLDNPRMLAVAEDGSVYVTQRKPGSVVLIRDLDGDGYADTKRVVARMAGVHGIAIAGGHLFLADVKTVKRARIRADGSLGRLMSVVRDLPDGGQHPNRTLAFGPEGALYVTVGSTCNACMESDPESATLLRVWPERREIFASGLRNTIGFGWHPKTQRLYGMDHGIDWLGDETPGEELNEIRRATRYGWPFVYGNDSINPQDEPPNFTSEEWAMTSQEPVAMYTAHSAPMQMVFYTGKQFPASYRNDAFVAMRGSWNRKPPSGYEIVRIRFTDDGTFEAFEPFVTGFLQSTPDGKHGYIGRPTGIAQARDGSLLVSDDSNGAIYRIAHGKVDGRAPPGYGRLAGQEIQAKAPSTMELQSEAVDPAGRLADRHSDYKAGISPALRWSGIPEGTRSLVLLMEDPEAGSPIPFLHWSVANISPDLRGLRENMPDDDHPLPRSRMIQGANSHGSVGYFGPRPPPGDAPHPYHFQLFALDGELDLPAGFTRGALLEAMRGRVLASGELVGRVDKPHPSFAQTLDNPDK